MEILSGNGIPQKHWGYEGPGLGAPGDGSFSGPGLGASDTGYQRVSGDFGGSYGQPVRGVL